MFSNYIYLLPNLVTIFYSFFIFYFFVNALIFFNNYAYFFFDKFYQKYYNKNYTLAFSTNVFYLVSFDSLEVNLFSEFGSYVHSFINLLYEIFIEGMVGELSIYFFALFNNYFSFVFSFQHYFLFFVIFSPLFNSILLGLFGSY